MQVTTERGTIKSVRLGYGGYDDAMFGFTFILTNGCWEVQDFWGTWSERTEECKWTTGEQSQTFLDALLRVKQLMKTTGKKDFQKLAGVPIKMTFEGSRLKSWYADKID